MGNTLHTTFANAEDGIRAVEALLHEGVRTEDICLVLPQQAPSDATITSSETVRAMAHSSTTKDSMRCVATVSAREIAATVFLPEPPPLPSLPRLAPPRYYGNEDFMAPGAPGYRYDALGAVIPDRVPKKTVTPCIGSCHEAKLNTEQGAALGLVFGLLIAMCVPGIGLSSEAALIVISLMTACTVIGGLAGGLYGYFVDRWVDYEVAKKIHNHAPCGCANVSVTVSGAFKEAEIARIIRRFGGRLVLRPENQ